MANDSGWIKVFRHILKDKTLWLINEPYDSRSAYLYLALNAQYQESKIIGKYTKQVITVPKGALIRSLKDLSKEWAWSIGKTRRFLSRLSDIGAVTLSSTPDGTLITLIDYGKSEDARQGSEQGSEHTYKQRDRHEGEHDHRHDHRHEGGIHNKKDKESKDSSKKFKESKEGAAARRNPWEGDPE